MKINLVHNWIIFFLILHNGENEVGNENNIIVLGGEGVGKSVLKDHLLANYFLS